MKSQGRSLSLMDTNNPLKPDSFTPKNSHFTKMPINFHKSNKKKTIIKTENKTHKNYSTSFFSTFFLLYFRVQNKTEVIIAISITMPSNGNINFYKLRKKT